MRNPIEPWASIALSQVTYVVVKTADTAGAIVIGDTTMVPILVLMHAIVRQPTETRTMSALPRERTYAVHYAMSLRARSRLLHCTIKGGLPDLPFAVTNGLLICPVRSARSSWRDRAIGMRDHGR